MLRALTHVLSFCKRTLAPEGNVIDLSCNNIGISVEPLCAFTRYQLNNYNITDTSGRFRWWFRLRFRCYFLVISFQRYCLVSFIVLTSSAKQAKLSFQNCLHPLCFFSGKYVEQKVWMNRFKFKTFFALSIVAVQRFCVNLKNLRSKEWVFLERLENFVKNFTCWFV